MGTRFRENSAPGTCVRCGSPVVLAVNVCADCGDRLERVTVPAWAVSAAAAGYAWASTRWTPLWRDVPGRTPLRSSPAA